MQNGHDPDRAVRDSVVEDLLFHSPNAATGKELKASATGLRKGATFAIVRSSDAA
jgi:hypothetical protein